MIKLQLSKSHVKINTKVRLCDKNNKRRKKTLILLKLFFDISQFN